MEFYKVNGKTKIRYNDEDLKALKKSIEYVKTLDLNSLEDNKKNLINKKVA